MNKSVFTFLTFLMMATLTARAQQYEVYRIRGEASLVVKQQQTPLAKEQVLTPKDIISLAYRSEVKMIVRETQEMITLKGQCAGSIASLIDQQQNARQKMTPDYFNFVISNLKGEGYNEGLQAEKSTTIYRDDTDSLFQTTGEAYLAEAADADSIHLPVLVLRPTFLAKPARQMSAPAQMRRRAMKALYHPYSTY